LKEVQCPHCNKQNKVTIENAHTENCLNPRLQKCTFCESFFLFDKEGITHTLSESPANEDALKKAAEYMMPEAQQERLHVLLDKNNEGELTLIEHQELKGLIAEYEERMLQKAEARVRLMLLNASKC